MIIKVRIFKKYLNKILLGEKTIEFRQIGKKSFIILEDSKRTVKANIDNIFILPKFLSFLFKIIYPDIKWKNEKIIQINIKNPKLLNSK